MILIPPTPMPSHNANRLTHPRFGHTFAFPQAAADKHDQSHQQRRDGRQRHGQEFVPVLDPHDFQIDSAADFLDLLIPLTLQLFASDIQSAFQSLLDFGQLLRSTLNVREPDTALPRRALFAL
jgi:hypothetical protein